MSNLKKEETDCIWCKRGLTKICGHEENSLDHVHDNGGSDVSNSDGLGIDPELQDLSTYKTDATLKDQQSTGRKRAAKLYPLDPEKFCEWSGKRNQGGGKSPIDGCGIRPGTIIGRQFCRHHGPDKNTLNNEVGNVHRICTPCHNEWHAKNDKDYLPGQIIGD